MNASLPGLTTPDGNNDSLSVWLPMTSVWRALCFFSSRRRHTRCYRDWSSDVCSSDLMPSSESSTGTNAAPDLELLVIAARMYFGEGVDGLLRSEERRVGKEGRSR